VAKPEATTKSKGATKLLGAVIFGVLVVEGTRDAYTLMRMVKNRS
jgi:hypothetical protein